MNETRKTCFFLDINLEKTQEVFITNILLCIVNSVFSVLTCLGNFIIIHTIRKVQDFHSPSFILLCCLAVSDLLVGAICQLLFVAFKIAEVVDNFNAYCLLRMASDLSCHITSGVSLLILAAVSIDRLLAVTLHLRYHMIVTVHRVYQTVSALWIFAISCTMLRFSLNNADWIFLPLVVFLLTLIAITLSTFKIFQIAQRHQRKIKDLHMAVLSATVKPDTVNVLKCKKSAVTVLYVYGLFLLLYFPFFVNLLMTSRTGYTQKVKIVYGYASTAIFINSFLNPLVYCWRIREVRRAVKNVLRGQW